MKKPKLFSKQIPSKDLVSEITNAIVNIYSLSPREYSSNLFHDLAVGFKSFIYAMEHDREDPNVVHPLFIKWFKLYVWLQHQINQKDDIRAKFEAKIPVCATYILASLQYQNSIANYHQSIMEMFLTLFESAQPQTIQNIVNMDMEIIAQLWIPVEFVGDYITQRQCLKLIVAVLKHLSLEERQKKVLETKLNEELQKLILKLAADPNNFEEISRELLNSYNMNNSKNSTVFSVNCTKALLESSEIFKPEQVSKFWIDFNYASKTVSLLFQLKQSERKQVELYVQMKIDKLQLTNQLDCSVFSIQPAFFSINVPSYLRNARRAVFTLAETQVERLKANSDLFDYYNTFSSEIHTPNTIEQYLMECSDESIHTPYSGDGNNENQTIIPPVMELHKYNPETKDSNDGESINLTIRDNPVINDESTSMSRGENFVNQSAEPTQESGYNTFANTNILEDNAIFKKPKIPPIKRKRSLKGSTPLEPMKSPSKLQESNQSEETLAPIKKVSPEKKKTKSRNKNEKPSNPKKEVKLPANNEETETPSGKDVISDEVDIHRESGSIDLLVSKPGSSSASPKPTKEEKEIQKSIQISNVVSDNPVKQMPLLLPQLSQSLEQKEQLSDTSKQSRRKTIPTQNITEQHQSSTVQSNEQESSGRSIDKSHLATNPLESIVKPTQQPTHMPLLFPQLSESSQEPATSTPKSSTSKPKTSKPENPQVSGMANLLSTAESILQSSNCEQPPHESSKNLDETKSVDPQLSQGTNRRFFKTKILRNSTSSAQNVQGKISKAKPKSRKKTEPRPTQQQVIQKPKNVNRVKPLNYLTEPEPEDTAQGSPEIENGGRIESNSNRKSAAEILKEKQKTDLQNLIAIQKQHDVFENPDQDCISKAPKRRSRKQKTLPKNVEVSKVVPYSAWKLSQNKKNNNNKSTMRSPGSEQENEVPRSTRQEEAGVSNFHAYSLRKTRKKGKNNTEPPKILSQRLEQANKITESNQESLDPFDRLKKLNIENKVNLTSKKFVPLVSSSSSSSISNGNYIVLDSDEEDERNVDSIQMNNGEEISRWIEMVRGEQLELDSASSAEMLSPVPFPFEIGERSTRTSSRETILTPVKVSLELDNFPVVSPSQPQNDSNRLLQNILTTSYTSPVYEILDDEIPVDQPPIEDDHQLEDISRPASPASKHFSNAEPVGTELSIQPFHLQSHQNEIAPRDDETQSEEISLTPSNSEFVEEFLPEVTELRPTSSNGSLISVYETSGSNEQECSALSVQQNITNQVIVQHHHYVLGPTRKRTHSFENSEASPPKISALTQYKPLKGYAELLPNFIEKITTEKGRVLLELESKLHKDIFQYVNETFEAVTKSIDYHETPIKNDQEKEFSLLEKLEWQQKSIQKSQLDLEKIQGQIVECTQKSLNAEDRIEKLYKEAEEALKTYADVVKKELWQNFSNDIINSISERLTRLSNI